MIAIDMRTVILSYLISNAICLMVIGSLWFQDRRNFSGLGLWLVDYALQFVALLLIMLRGVVPDLLSATVGNTMVIGGTVLLYMGLERFVGLPGRQIHNAALVLLFALVHAYFVSFTPNLEIRTLLLSLALLAICGQCAWLLLHRVPAEMRPVTRALGLVFLAYCAVSLARILVDLTIPLSNDFFHSNFLDTAAVLAYQMLFIVLTLALFLMVNRRLLSALERDIAARHQVETALVESEVHYRLTLDNMIEGCQIIGPDWRYFYLNKAAEAHNRRPNAELLGQFYMDMWPGIESTEVFRLIKRCKDERVPAHIENEFEFENKEKRWFELSIQPVPEGTFILSVDITDRKQTEAAIDDLQRQLREQAIRDPLTGLFNRRFLAENLEREIARARREHYPVSFVMIDLDQFKALNDTLGHLAGDAVLKRLAAQILSHCRVSDIVCRYGGEEFLALLPNTPAEHAIHVAEHWRKTFMGSGVPLEKTYANPTISCGVSEFPAHGSTPDELIAAADGAMYQAKARGRNQVVIWSEDHRRQAGDAFQA